MNAVGYEIVFYLEFSLFSLSEHSGKNLDWVLTQKSFEVRYNKPKLFYLM